MRVCKRACVRARMCPCECVRVDVCVHGAPFVSKLGLGRLIDYRNRFLRISELQYKSRYAHAQKSTPTRLLAVSGSESSDSLL